MNKIPFSYAGAMEYNKGKGITEDVFKDYALDKFGVSNNDAKKIFDEIDRNDSGGLREREFDKWTREATDNTTNTDTSTTTTSLTTSVSPNVSTSGGDRGSSLNNIPGVRIGETSRLKRDSDYGGSVNDKLTTKY